MNALRTALSTIPPRQRLAAGLMLATCIALWAAGLVFLANSHPLIGAV